MKNQYRVTLTHTGTTSTTIREYDHSTLNHMIENWMAAGFSIDIEAIP